MKPETEGARPKPAACRRLFADDDDPQDNGLRDNMFNQIAEQITHNLEEACKKYNFDFRSEVPLEGDWTWERVAPEDDGDAAKANAESSTTGPPGVSEGSPSQPPTTAPQEPPPAPLQPPTVPQ